MTAATETQTARPLDLDDLPDAAADQERLWNWQDAAEDFWNQSDAEIADRLEAHRLAAAEGE